MHKLYVVRLFSPNLCVFFHSAEKNYLLLSKHSIFKKIWQNKEFDVERLTVVLIFIAFMPVYAQHMIGIFCQLIFVISSRMVIFRFLLWLWFLVFFSACLWIYHIYSILGKRKYVQLSDETYAFCEWTMKR